MTRRAHRALPDPDRIVTERELAPTPTLDDALAVIEQLVAVINPHDDGTFSVTGQVRPAYLAATRFLFNAYGVPNMVFAARWVLNPAGMGGCAERLLDKARQMYRAQQAKAKAKK